jgi:pimeloyl-ACP methyl ester carboxylesterase
VRGYFLPGWGAPPSLYAAGLPAGWTTLRAPSFALTKGSLERYVDWLAAIVAAEPRPVALGGHSMGAALAIMAAHRHPARVDRLVLVGPAGLPLTKPLAASLRDFARQLAGRAYPREVARSIADGARAPRAALRLARAVRALELERELASLRAWGVPCHVVACTSDTLTTSAHCERIATLAAADYRELRLPGGHMWMLGHRREFAALFRGL